MAKFCLECFNEVNETDFEEWDVSIDYFSLELCEGCGKWKNCVFSVRPWARRKLYKKGGTRKKRTGCRRHSCGLAMTRLESVF